MRQLHRHWNNVKSFVGGHYQRASKMVGQLDGLFGIGRRAFAAVAPILEDFGQGDAVQAGVRAIGGYDAARAGIMQADSYARHHGNRIAEARIID